jgi:proteasome assembly chaperone (PAC2) family protein
VALADTSRILDDLRTQHLREPYVVAGFGGWINAGSASTAALEHLVEEFSARKVVELDPELFYQFSDTRPTTTLNAQHERIHTWPQAEIYVARTEGVRDLVLFVGPEPNLRWRTFAESLIEAFQTLGATALLTLGAILAPVHHRARVQMRGWGTNSQFRAALRQRRIGMSRYEGPTGIATVLHALAAERGLPGAGLTASTPSYVPGMVHPWTAAAMLRVVDELTGVPLPLGALERAGAALADQIDEFLAKRPSLRERIEALRADEPESESESESEKTPDVSARETREPEPGGELPSSEAVLRDLEEFLRGLRGEESS